MLADKLESFTDEVKAQMGTLFEEYRASGLGIDEFMKKKLSEFQEGGEKCANAMLRTFEGIDVNYKDLSDKLQEGMARHQWLGEKIKKIAAEEGAGDKPEIVGGVLAMATDALNGKKEGTTTPTSFENGDIPRIAQDLEEAIVNRTMSNINAK